MTEQHTPQTQAPTQAHLASVMFVFIATAMFAFKGIIAKYAYANAVPVDTVLIIRFTAAVPLFWLVAIGLKAMMPPAEAPQSPKLKHIGLCAVTGLLFYLASRFDFTALSYLPAGVSRLILFTFPAVVLILNAMITRSWPKTSHMAAFCVTYVGLMILLLPSTRTNTSLSAAGTFYALGASVFYAVFLVLNQRLVRELSTLMFTALTNTFTMLWFGVEALLMTPEWSLGHDPWLTFVLMSVMVAFTTVVPFFLMNEGVRRLGSSEASLISLTGPAITVFSAWWLLNEVLSLQQLVGCLIIVGGIAVMKGAIPRGLARRWTP